MREPYLDIQGYFSSDTIKVIKECRQLADRLQSDCLSLYFFLWLYPKYSPVETKEFAFPYSQKKQVIRMLKGKEGQATPQILQLTSDFEVAIMESDLQQRLLKSKEIKPEHIFLSALSSRHEEKQTYIYFLSRFPINKYKLLFLRASVLSISHKLKLLKIIGVI
ncbi:hypothetical protein [Spirosoma knui]